MLTKDDKGVVLFDQPIKIYLFKHEKEVKVSFKLTDYCVTNRTFTQEEFENILENWDVDEGIQGMHLFHENSKIWWYLSRSGPRPVCEPANFVSVNFNRFNFRFSVCTMSTLKLEYARQKNNVMHWD